MESRRQEHLIPPGSIHGLPPLLCLVCSYDAIYIWYLGEKKIANSADLISSGSSAHSHGALSKPPPLFSGMAPEQTIDLCWRSSAHKEKVQKDVRGPDRLQEFVSVAPDRDTFRFISAETPLASSHSFTVCVHQLKPDSVKLREQKVAAGQSFHIQPCPGGGTVVPGPPDQGQQAHHHCSRWRKFHRLSSIFQKRELIITVSLLTLPRTHW